jgi:hypothetical protein
MGSFGSAATEIGTSVSKGLRIVSTVPAFSTRMTQVRTSNASLLGIGQTGVRIEGPSTIRIIGLSLISRSPPTSC